MIAEVYTLSGIFVLSHLNSPYLLLLTMLFSTTSFATTTEHQEAQTCLYAVPPMERRGFFDSLKTRVEGLQQTANLIDQLIKHWGHLIDELTIDMAKESGR